MISTSLGPSIDLPCSLTRPCPCPCQPSLESSFCLARGSPGGGIFQLAFQKQGSWQGYTQDCQSGHAFAALPSQTQVDWPSESRAFLPPRRPLRDCSRSSSPENRNVAAHVPLLNTSGWMEVARYFSWLCTTRPLHFRPLFPASDLPSSPLLSTDIPKSWHCTLLFCPTSAALPPAFGQNTTMAIIIRVAKRNFVGLRVTNQTG
ncbi:hypothetical protein BKA80DRAFT_5836 [Phyllosticta citrichinensis]